MVSVNGSIYLAFQEHSKMLELLQMSDRRIEEAIAKLPEMIEGAMHEKLLDITESVFLARGIEFQHSSEIESRANIDFAHTLIRGARNIPQGVEIAVTRSGQVIIVPAKKKLPTTFA